MSENQQELEQVESFGDGTVLSKQSTCRDHTPLQTLKLSSLRTEVTSLVALLQSLQCPVRLTSNKRPKIWFELKSESRINIKGKVEIL